MTLTELADLFACAALLMGLLFIALGVLGMLKLPDVYTRMHAASKCTTLGLLGVTTGTALHLCTLPGANIAEVLTCATVLICFQFLAGPIGAHLLGKAAHSVGSPMCDATVDDELKRDQRKSK